MTSRFYYLLQLQAEDLEYYKQEDSLTSIYWEFFFFFSKQLFYTITNCEKRKQLLMFMYKQKKQLYYCLSRIN